MKRYTCYGKEVNILAWEDRGAIIEWGNDHKDQTPIWVKLEDIVIKWQ